MIRIRDPIVKMIRTIVKSFSSPNFCAKRGEKEEQRANMTRGKLVKSPSELSETWRPSAISDRTIGKTAKGVRKTSPTMIMPGTKNAECFFIKFSSNESFLSV